MAIPGEEKGCTDFNVFSGAENGILKCISINTKANLLKNFNHNSAPLDREQEITWYVFQSFSMSTLELRLESSNRNKNAFTYLPIYGSINY